jgi:hypothetical protein
MLDATNIDNLNEESKVKFIDNKTMLLQAIEKSLETIKLNGSRESTLKVNMELQIKDVKESKTKLETELAMATSRLKVIEDKISDTLPTLEIDLTGDMQYEELNAKVKELESETDTDDSEAINKLLENKRKVQADMETLKSQLAMRENKKRAEERITELTIEGKRLAGLMADEKKVQYQCEQFLKAKAQLLESNINSLFSSLSFRLFDIQINEGIRDDCTPMIRNEVEYKDASHSEQIRANLEICAVMQRAANISVPVFCDNCEAATWLPKMDCQLIRLYVSEKDKTIRIVERGEENE